MRILRICKGRSSVLLEEFMTMTDLRVQILTIEQAESKGWNNMVAEHPLGSVYQHTAFGRVIASTFGHLRPYYMALLDESGRYVGGLALFLVKSWLTGSRLVSIPWACYADPMIGSLGEFEILFREIIELSRREKASYVEIRARNSASLLANTNLMIPVYYDKCHSLDLTTGLNAVWDGFNRTSVKQKIKKAERNGIKVRLAESKQEVISFYQVFGKDRRRLGLPPQRPEFFQNIWTYLVPLGLAHFWVAYLHNQLVGGLCTFTFKETVICSYIAVEESLRCRGAGQGLIWRVIRAASEAGLRIVDLGKTSQHNHGLLYYKRTWGGLELEAPVFYYPRIMGVSSYGNEKKLSYRTMQLFWRILPAGLAKVASTFFYRHMG